MKKMAFGFVMVFTMYALGVHAQEYGLSQKDITEFLAFADGYKDLAGRYIRNAEQKSVSEIFYSTDSEKWVAETEKFLKSKGWTFDRMNQFLYTVYLALLAINYEDAYASDSPESGEDLFEDVSQAAKALVRKNRKALSVYFPEDNEYGSEADEEIEYTDAAETGDDPPLIDGEIALTVKTDSDITVNVVFVSGAQDLLLVASIVRGEAVIKEEEPVRVKPWTVKGGRIDWSWKFAKKGLKKGTYTARVVISDLDGERVGEQDAEFTVR